MDGQQPGRRRAVAIVNMKGGSTKTTTAVNLGAALVGLGRTVRIIDADPQEGSVTHWLPPQDDVGQGLLEVFNETRSLDEATARTSVERLFLVPSWESLRAVDRRRGDEAALRMALMESQAAVDYDIIDCPHSQDALAIAGIAAADELIVPVQASELDVVGMSTLLEIHRKIKRTYRPNQRIAAIVVGRVKGRSGLDAELIEHFRVRYPDSVVAPITDTVRMREATAAHQPITTFDRRGRATADFAAFAGTFDSRWPA